MTDNLTVFGTDFTNVAGLKVTGTGNGTLTYVRPQGTTTITANGTNIDVSQYATANVNVAGGEDNTFVVNINWNDSTNRWEPDHTDTEMRTAYDAGKTIVTQVDPSYEWASYTTADGIWYNQYHLYRYTVCYNAGANQVYYWAYTYEVGDIVCNVNGTEYIVPNLQTKTVTPSEVAQTVTPDSGYNGLSQVDVGAISNTYVGTGITQRSSTDLTVSGATVTAPAGYYASAATKTVTAGTAGTPTAAKGTVSSHSVTVTPSVTNTTGYITGGTKTGTAVTISASELVSGTLTVTENNTYDVTNLASMTVSVSGGSADLIVSTKTATPSSAGSSISFTGLSGEPTSFSIMSTSDLTTGTSPFKVAAVVFDGANLHGQIVTNTSNANATYDGSSFSKSYSNGTLTVTSSSHYFQANQYKLVYTYGGSSSSINTKDVQVDSGATNITFTGLEDEPSYWSLIFKSNFGTSSGYQRVICVTNDSTNTYGMDLDSSAHAATAWTATYSNGSLTVSSTSTNNGGYFHQPGYYQLTYAIGGNSTVLNLQTKTNINPTTNSQTIMADTGYDGLASVQINAMPAMSLPTSVSSSHYGTSKLTVTPGAVAQYINIPTGYNSSSAYYTVNGDTNLVAGNIKSGTTIFGIQGTYSGGGSSMNVQIAQSTSRATSSTYTKIVELTCSTAGTYDIYWDCFRSSTSGTSGSQLYVGDTASGNANTTFTNHVQTNHRTGVSLSANQTVAVYARSRGSNYYAYVPTLVIKQTA